MPDNTAIQTVFVHMRSNIQIEMSLKAQKE